MSNMRFRGNRNIFANYQQDENCFTNGLFSLLEVASVEESVFPRCFIKHLLNIPVAEAIESFSVLRGEKAQAKGNGGNDERVTVDGEIIGPDVYLAFETKITRGYGLTEEQIRRHLETAIRPRSESMKKLVLLTPDDGTSSRIRGFLEIAPGLVTHLAWKSVYDYLDGYRAKQKAGVLAKLFEEYLDVIKETIIEQDFVGIIMKVQFNKTTEMFNRDDIVKELSKTVGWRLPHERWELDGKGKKLLISEPKTRAITIEAEVREGGANKRTGTDPDYPFSNYITPGSIMAFEPPITLERIQQCIGLEHFGKHRAYTNLRSYQYEQLTKGVNKRPVKPC